MLQVYLRITPSGRGRLIEAKKPAVLLVVAIRSTARRIMHGMTHQWAYFKLFHIFPIGDARQHSAAKSLFVGIMAMGHLRAIVNCLFTY